MKFFRCKRIKKVKKIIRITLILILFVITIHYAASLSFSEIMPNPQGSDTGREWIELSNPECHNLTAYNLLDNGIIRVINYYEDGACQYPIICDDCTLLSGEINTSPAIYESSFTLNNNGEYIAIILNGTIIDELNYSTVPEGKSLTRYENEWIIAYPTPGYYFFANQSLENESITNETINETNETISNNTILQNETSNETCNISIGVQLITQKEIYLNKESIKFKNTLSDIYENTYTIEYWIEDLSGTVVKSKISTNNLNEKSYTPSISSMVEALIIKNRIKEVSCSNIGLVDSEKMIVVHNPNYEDEKEECEEEQTTDVCALKEESELKLDIKDAITLKAYRGDDRKYVIDIYSTDDKGKRSHTYGKLRLEKYSGAEIEFEQYKNEEYCGEQTIVAEGLGFTETKTVHIACSENFDNSKTQKQSTPASVASQNISQNNKYEAVENARDTANTKTFNHTIPTGSVIYESKNEYSKQYSLIGIIILVSGATIYGAYKIILHKKAYKNKR
ncbi:MAG: hypothetical protein ACP5NV_01685 [Candidatus Woesearchaeota archaeon]